MQMHEIGTEWREYSEEHNQTVSQNPLQLARLRRQRDRIVAWRGEDIYRHIEANLHWELFQFLGKLAQVVYVLRHDERPGSSPSPAVVGRGAG